jgi:2-dehydro-3-deoxy-D-arabinonate dehydratase
MKVVRYLSPESAAPLVGRCDDGFVRPVDVGSMAELLRQDVPAIRALLEAAASAPAVEAPRLLPPVDGRTEVWAAGITYERSLSARMAESTQPSVYDLVYEAKRPELFFKAPAWRVVTDGDPISVRGDSENSVPEPELALVLTAGGDIAGYTVCNDVSSRSIEGANPLYLSQAKLYDGSCALAPGWRPAWEIPDPYALTIRIMVVREGASVWTGATSTSTMHRRLDDLVTDLGRELSFPDGAVLSTGTGLVPGSCFTLCPGDVVTIQIEDVGQLRTPTVAGRSVRVNGRRSAQRRVDADTPFDTMPVFVRGGVSVPALDLPVEPAGTRAPVPVGLPDDGSLER